MKMPGQCPICRGVMSNEYSGQRQQHFVKQCTKKVTHHIVFKADSENHDNVHYFFIALSGLSPGLRVFWYPENNHVLLDTFKSSERLPYFEPDFTNYRKLISKLKTYILFS